MLRANLSGRVAGLAALLLFVVLGCSPSLNDSASPDWYIELTIDPNSSRAVSVTELSVTGLDIQVLGPQGGVLHSVSWQASEGSQTYIVPVAEEGEHRLDVTHRAVEDGEEVEVKETATFSIRSMIITEILVTPGLIGWIDVDQGRPDLVVSALSVACWSPTSVTYNYIIKNIGSGPANLDGPTGAGADNVSVQAFVSADDIFANAGDIAAGGTILGISPLGLLYPGETFSGSFSASITGFVAGVHQNLVLMVDWGDVVEETIESNNTLAAPLGPEGCHPDLVVSDLTVTAFTSTTISYKYTVTNNGGAPANLDGPTGSNADNVSVQAFMSSDTIFANAGDVPAGGTIIGISPLGNLNPGDSVSGAFSSTTTVDRFKLPYLVLKADWGGVVAESDEGNNTLATTY